MDGNVDIDRLREVAAHDEVKMFEIKLSQGAKPGKGGILPGGKVTEEIAKIRGIRPGADSISPNRHEDINSVSDLLDFIGRVRDGVGKPVGFKAVIGAYGWLDSLFNEINKRGIDAAPDFIAVDGRSQTQLWAWFVAMCHQYRYRRGDGGEGLIRSPVQGGKTAGFNLAPQQ